MYEETLMQIGLSLNEARVYESMLQLGEANVQTIAIKSKVHRRNVYDSLNKLIEKGLASEVFIKGEKHFKAMHPQRLNFLLAEKQVQLEKALPDMKKKFVEKETDAQAYIYKGVQGVKQYLQDILETKETGYFIGAKAMWLDPRLKHFLPRFEKERIKKGITFKHIFDYEVKKQTPEILKVVGKPYKFLPKNYSSPTMIDIFGPYIVTFIGVKPGIMKDEPIQFVMKNRELADGYRKFFQFMWDHIAEE